MRSFTFLLICAVLVSCKDDGSSLCGSSVCYENGVFILNEGLFNQSNASVTFYNHNEMTTESDIYFSNNIVKIGDIVQSGHFHDGFLYMVVNNSQKIVKVSPADFALQSTISVSGSPRNMYAVSNNKAYVTDLFDGIHVLDLLSETVTMTIHQDGWTEEMVQKGNFLYITKRYFDSRKSKVLKLDILSDIVTDSLEIRPNASSMVIDANGNAWVLCGGDTAAADKSAIVQLDLDNLTILNEIELNDQTAFGGPSELNIDGSGQELYYLNVDLFKMGINETTEPAAPFIAASSRNFYDFNIEETSGDVYVCDAKDFVQRGSVYRYDNSATLIEEIQVGIIPGEVIFNF